MTSVLLDMVRTNNLSTKTKQEQSVEISEIPLNADLSYVTIYATIYYDDGSYKLSAISDITDQIDKTIFWSDGFGSYSAQLKYGEIGNGSVIEITLDPNGGTLADGTSKQQEVVYGRNFTLPVPSKKGYEFAGWYIDDRQLTDDNGQGKVKWDISKIEKHLVAKYNVIDYTISYHNPDDAINTNPTSYTVEDNSINLKPAIKRGYTFIGWYSDSSLQNEVDNIYTSQAEDIELWAKFITTPVTTAVNNENAGKVTKLENGYCIGQQITITATTNEGYTFLGWYKGDTQLTTEESYSITITEKTVTYTAKWELIRYTITYHNTYNCTNDNPQYYTVQDESFSFQELSMEAGEFIAWCTDSNLEYEIDTVDVSQAKDIELWAKWEYAQYDLTFNYDSNVGDFDGNKPTKYTIEGLTLPQLVGRNGNGHFGIEWRDEAGKIYTNEIPQGTTGDLTLTLTKWSGHTWGSDGKCIYCKALKEPYSEVGGEVKPYTMSDGKIIFGTYPQSKVEDTALQSMLNAEIQNKLPSSENANGWTDYGYYISGEVQSYMWYVDVEYQGAKYRGVYFTSYRPHFLIYPSWIIYTYQVDNGYNTKKVYWFKWEPITWRILKNAGGEALIVSDLIIDSQQFYHEYGGRTIDGKTVYDNNYKESDIRKWLNADFYNAAFDELSKDFIIQTEVDNSLSSTGDSSNEYVCENTNDSVFLLSYQEATNSSYGLNKSTRQLKTTDYAQCQGARAVKTGGYKDCGWWWLRSPYFNQSDRACSVRHDGDDNDDAVRITSNGVVPALNITL